MYALSCGTKRMHLQPQNYTTTNGTDSVGAYTSATVLLTVQDSSGPCSGIRYETTFKYYASLGAVIFKQSFPDGLPGGKDLPPGEKLSATSHSGEPGLHAIIPPGLQTAFPLWDQPPKPTGWLTWGGMFMGATYGVVPGGRVSYYFFNRETIIPLSVALTLALALFCCCLLGTFSNTNTLPTTITQAGVVRSKEDRSPFSIRKHHTAYVSVCVRACVRARLLFFLCERYVYVHTCISLD